MKSTHRVGGDGIALGCRCGGVHGRVVPAWPAFNRVICYCDDCQAYAHWLHRADLLDARGGSDIVQVPPAALSFVQGREHIVGVRLAPRGLHRWYARCCHTPVGNTVSPAIPFVGLPAAAFAVAGQDPDALFGPPTGAIKGEYAVGVAPPGTRGIAPRLLASAIAKVLGWRLTGRTWPHPFYERATGEPMLPLATLSSEEREALRPLCGPRPSARGTG